MEYELIGKRVKKARKDKGITQEKFAEELGVSVSFISQVETGEKKFNLARISEVSKILERPISYFVDGYDKERNIVFEYDEKCHYIDAENNVLKQRDLERQKTIKETLNCRFIRYNEKMNLLYEV